MTDVFAALGDPTRRTVLREVSERGSATATELAAPLGDHRARPSPSTSACSPTRTSSTARREGRETRFRPTPAPLGDAISWMTGIGGAWDERLAALERHVETRRARGR